MKTLILIIVSLIIGLLKGQAQETKEKYEVTTTTKMTTTHCHKNKECDYSRSYVFLDLESKFKIKLKFMDKFLPEVKTYLMDQLGEKDLVLEEETYIWKKESDGEELYEVKLNGNRVRISFNKTHASDKQIHKFETIGKELKTITSSKPEKN